MFMIEEQEEKVVETVTTEAPAAAEEVKEDITSY